MYSFIPTKVRYLITAIRDARTYRAYDCEVCDLWWRRHHRTCCLCRDCRRHLRSAGRCYLCEVNG